ncbi:MAG: substrate-binding domain-containing protein [Bacteroidota bacterium]|jgi:signal transduction histidine kinase/DNA-binding response OmpR family regulator
MIRNYKNFLFLLIFLFSCQGGQKNHFVIGFSQCTMGDSWRKTMVEGMERELAFHSNVQMKLVNANGNSVVQKAQIQQFIDDKVDLIIVSPNEASPLTPVIEKAYDAGIPVVVVDRQTTSEKYTAFVGANNKLVGQNAGIYANILLKGNGEILEIGEGANTSPTIGRHDGFAEIIAQHPDLALKKSIFSDWNADYQAKIMAFLSQNRQLNLIFAHNDRLALRAANICEKLGFDNKIKIIGVDGLYGENQGIDLVDKGILSATILYPTGGEESIQIAMKILEKQPFKKENELFTTVINPENVRIMKQQSLKVTEQQETIKRQSLKMDDLNQIYSSQKNILYITATLLSLVLIFGALMLFLFREKQLSNQKLEEQNIAIREQNQEIERVSLQAKNATEEKMRFYSYISHEFKTPLSLILTPTEDLLQRKNFEAREVKNTLQFIRKNTYRLLRLVDQLLDLRKLDAGKMELKVSTHDLAEFVREIVQDFSVQAKIRQIDFQFICPFPEFPYPFDVEKLDKVLFNIISNAFKYTSDGGRIHVSLMKNIDSVEIIISDNGTGMNERDMEHAFDLFYRSNQNTSLGTGLGLALSREFVSLHEGEILLESVLHQGTNFKIKLPLKNTELQKIEKVVHLSQYFVDEETITDSPETMPENFENSMIIIEDNTDLLRFLREKFKRNFQVYTAESAEKGWEIILKNVPDIVISDVMLPGKDGFLLTQELKTDFRTSHIPVVLLTAKGQIESQIEGTKAGADAYLSKPFNQQLLEEKVKSLLENRSRMRRRFSNEITNPHDVHKVERKFLLDFELLIEKYLNDNTLSVEKLSQEMGMSRVQLYRKITALTGKNVNDYIAEYKIRKAKQLLQDASKNITEIAYELGFNNPSYFTTFFKQKTNQTPTEWRNS